jgi:hypothetical protein
LGVSKRYVQRLPVLGLSIERHTEAVPNDAWWYLLRDGEIVGRYRTLKAAQTAWSAFVEASGWKPPPRPDRTPAEILAEEKRARDRDARNEYWHSGRRHAW